jgi:hypothetical protein
VCLLMLMFCDSVCLIERERERERESVLHYGDLLIGWDGYSSFDNVLETLCLRLETLSLRLANDKYLNDM